MTGGQKKRRFMMAAKTTSEINTSPPTYDHIINLVAASIGDDISFPGDLVVNILLKLPVKSVLRFKTVCKPWNLLINHPGFIKEFEYLHRKNHPLGWYALYHKEYSSQEKEDTSILPIETSYIVGACNGIVCLETSTPEKPLLLFNPFTREFSFVPPGLYGWTYGFFYISKTQEYQIISFCYQDDNIKKVDITILTLGKTTSLREIKDVRVPGLLCKLKKATSGTTVVWLGLDFYIPFKEIVICYDVIDDKFTKMDVPPSASCPFSYSRSLGTLKDSVIMFVSPKVETTFFDIWMLVEDVSKGKNWMKYKTVGPLKTSIIVDPIDVCWDDKWVLCRHKRDEGSDRYCSRPVYKSSDLFYYDLETDQVNDYKITDPPIRAFVNYVESLVSIKSLLPRMDTSY